MRAGGYELIVSLRLFSSFFANVVFLPFTATSIRFHGKPIWPEDAEMSIENVVPLWTTKGAIAETIGVFKTKGFLINTFDAILGGRLLHFAKSELEHLPRSSFFKSEIR